MMLAVLFANGFAPLIDYYVVKANILRRQNRTAKSVNPTSVASVEKKHEVITEPVEVN